MSNLPKNSLKNSNFISDDGLSNTRRTTPNTINTSSCHDYIKVRVDGLIDIPNSIQDINNAEEKHKDYSFILELCSILLLDVYDYHAEEGGKAGYLQFITYDEDICIFGGRQSERNADGQFYSYIELKGHALRMFEKRCLEQNKDVFSQYCDLFEFFNKCATLPSLGINLEFLRLDYTIDDYSNYISIRELQNKLRKGHYISKCKSLKQNLDYTKDSSNELIEEDDQIKEISSNIGWSCYLGGRTSRQLNIYDKAAERTDKGYSVITEHWLRYEGRFYHDNAKTAFSFFYKNVYHPRDSSKFESSVGYLLRQIIIFKEDNEEDEQHQYRVEDWHKWNQLTNSDADMDFVVQYSKEQDLSFNKSKSWLIKSPYMNLTLEFLVESKIYYDDFGVMHNQNYSIPQMCKDLGIVLTDNFIRFILALLNTAKDKINNKKLAIVNNKRSSLGYPKIRSLIDAKMIIEEYVQKEDFFNFDFRELEEEIGG